MDVSNNEQERAYELREAQALDAQLRAVEHAPLIDRRDARAAWIGSLSQAPELVAERLGWLIDGNYGKGAYDAARRILQRPRMNRIAALAQMLAALEWQCPATFARQGWKSLSYAERNRVNDMLGQVIEEAAKELRTQA